MWSVGLKPVASRTRSILINVDPNWPDSIKTWVGPLGPADMDFLKTFTTRYMYSIMAMFPNLPIFATNGRYSVC